MNRLLLNFILIGIVFLYFKYATMSESKKITQEEIDKKNFDPENLIINMGGKQVPFSKINKPHHVVIDPREHKPQVDAASFPDLEPAAKARELELAAKREHAPPK